MQAALSRAWLRSGPASAEPRGRAPGKLGWGGLGQAGGGPGQAGGRFRAGGSGGGVPGREGRGSLGQAGGPGPVGGGAARRTGPLASVPGAEGRAPSARRGSRSAAVAKCIFKAM